MARMHKDSMPEYPVRPERVTRRPTHPGEALGKDVLPALDMSVRAAAEKLRITRQTLHRVIAGKTAVTAIGLELGTLRAGLRTGDTDIFGDGSLMMLKTAGHTPGECSLQVKLKNGSVVLTGDTIHIRPQLETLAAMTSDYDMAEASASIRRLRDIRDRADARLWISHAPEDWVEYPHELE